MRISLVPSFFAWLTLCAGRATPSSIGELGQKSRRQDRLEIRNLSRLTAVSAVVAGDYMYVDGGALMLVDDHGNFEKQESSEMLAIPVTNSWTNRTVRYWTMDKEAPRNNFQYFFANDTGDGLYAWGGEATTGQVNDTSLHLWKFEPDDFGGGEWHVSEPADSEDFRGIRRNVGGGSVACGNKAFVLGGYTNNRTDFTVEGSAKVPTPGLVTYDMNTRQWTNESAAAFNSLGTFYRGSTLCLREHSDEGLVMFLGGEMGRLDLYRDPPEHYLSFDNITFYDPSTKKWFSQETRGSSPSRRSRFCAVSARSPEGTTEIFVYGGVNSRLSTAYDELYVLTIPGFQWFRADYAAFNPRADHACVLAGNRQMIVIGGMNEGISDQVEKYEDLDPWVNGLGVFDVSELQWKNHYEAGAEKYQSPAVVRQWYSDGHQDSVAWSSPEVRAMFLGDAPEDGDNGGNDDGDDDDEGNDQLGGNSGAPGPNSALVGGVTGGVVGSIILAATAAVLFWYRRRRTQRQQGEALTSKPPSPAKGGKPSRPVLSLSLGSLPVYHKLPRPAYHRSSITPTPVDMYGPTNPLREHSRRDHSKVRLGNTTTPVTDPFVTPTELHSDSRMELEAPPLHELEASIPQDRREAWI